MLATTLRRVRALLGLLLLLALAVGLPWALAATIGDPLDRWSSIRAGDMSDQDVIAVMAAVAYLAWATFALAVVVELVDGLLALAAHRPRREIRIPLLGVQQELARTLIATVLLLAPAVMSVAGPPAAAFASPPAAAGTSTPPRQAGPASSPTTTAGNRGQGSRAGPPSRQEHRPAGTYVIPEQGGMRTYWALAGHYLGDGQRWPEIWALNQGRRQHDGSVLSSPNLLRRGWRITVPAVAPNSPGARAGGHVEHAAPVHGGDSLSELATQDGVPDWRAVWPENDGRAEPGGQRFTDPHLIQPGWTVVLPGPPSSMSPGTTVPPHTSQPPTSPPHTSPPRTSPPHARPRTRTPGPTSHTPPSTPAQTHDGPPTRETRPVPAAGGTSSSEVVTVAEWAASLSAGAGVLAGGVYLAARTYRRRQFRRRGAGRAIAGPAPRHVPLEKVLVTEGAAGVRDVEFIDRALRGLSHSLAAGNGRLPAVLAARLTGQHFDLVLAEPRLEAPPAPWVAVTPTSWAVEKSAQLPVMDACGHVPAAPYPTLVSVGYTAAGEEWLVDLEQAGALTLAGDRERCLDLARFTVSELAHNVWSDQLTVTLAGEFGADLVQLNPSRLMQAIDIPAAAAAAANDARAVREVADAEHVDVLHGRLHDVAGDTWMPQVLFLAPPAEADPGDTAAIEELLDTVADGSARAAVAVVLLGAAGSGADAGLRLEVAAEGTLRIPSLEVTAAAQQLPAEQAGELAHYLAAVRDSGADVAMPPQPPDEDGHPAYADLAGAVLPEHTVPRPGQGAAAAGAVTPASAATLAQPGAEPLRAASVLPNPTRSYLVSTATPEKAIQALAPVVKPEISAVLLAKHPHLDEDLAAWNDPASDRPKLRLLGAVQLTAFGRAPDQKVAAATEAAAYLALHRHGVTGDRFAADFWPQSNYTIKDSNPKGLLHIVRAWLGLDPLTGVPCLPYAVAAGRASGSALYRMSGVLVDWDLFTRLRERAQARGGEGIGDLVAAMDLVSGAPLSKLRDRGGAWLADDAVTDAGIMSAAILDTASTVVSRALEEGELELARRMAEKAAGIDSGSDQPLIDLAAVCKAEGRTAEMGAMLRRIVTHHDGQVEEDVPEDTYEVLLRHGLVS